MIRIYFKQAWNLMRQEKLFSAVYIIGTGLSITVAMALAIIFYLKTANIYPETNRDRMLIVQSACEKSKDPDNEGTWCASLSENVVETCFRPLTNAVAMTAILRERGAKHYLQPDGSKEQLPVAVKLVDTAFWTVFPLRFVNGAPFTEADFSSGIRAAVISESLARRLFGTAEATGRRVSLDFSVYRVAGVVKDASHITSRTYAQLWIPYTVYPDYKSNFGPAQSLGRLEAYMLARSAGDLDKLKQEALENIRRYNSSLDEYVFETFGQPDSQWQSTFRVGGYNIDFVRVLLQYAMIFLVLLLIPAVSLSGMTESRMERRLAEMGVRRAFGAPVGRLTGQIISENFLFTMTGGAIGLLFSWLFVVLGRNWIMQLGQKFSELVPAGTDTMITPSMLLNIPVFAITLGACFLLNLLSALIPAWRAAHREIIYSLNDKK
jgi:putative ABC transport system permease protein